MSAVNPLIIEVRANEFADRAGNAHIPYGADAIIADALETHAAGASMYHWHGRGDDGVDRPDDVELHRAVTAALRPTDLILHMTLGFTSTQGDAATRLTTVRQLGGRAAVDIVPADIGAIVADEYDDAAQRFRTDDRVLLNRTGYLRELLGGLRDAAMPVLAVVWSPGGVRTALHLRDEGLLPAPTFWQLGFTGDAVPGGLPATEAQLLAFLDVLPDGEPWTIHVRDGDGLEMANLAILHGGHVSIGLGDDPYDRLGNPTNADLIRRVATMAESLGRPVATTSQARAITGLRRDIDPRDTTA